MKKKFLILFLLTAEWIESSEKPQIFLGTKTLKGKKSRVSKSKNVA